MNKIKSFLIAFGFLKQDSTEDVPATVSHDQLENAVSQINSTRKDLKDKQDELQSANDSLTAIGSAIDAALATHKVSITAGASLTDKTKALTAFTKEVDEKLATLAAEDTGSPAGKGDQGPGGNQGGKKWGDWAHNKAILETIGE